MVANSQRQLQPMIFEILKWTNVGEMVNSIEEKFK